MRVLLLLAFLASSLISASAADNAKRHGSPSLDETNEADKKAEYLESIPYKPCPSAVRMPNGQVECLGSPGEPYAWHYDQRSGDRRPAASSLDVIQPDGGAEPFSK
jgi:hypothetical protein